ncbi:hypothetical protein ACFQ0B_30720 [Nonomuraea thailandensis]
MGRVISPTPPSEPMIVAVAALVLTTTGRPPAMVTDSSSPGSPTLIGLAAVPFETGTTWPRAVTGTHRRPPPSTRAAPSGPGRVSAAPTVPSVTGSICWTLPAAGSTAYAVLPDMASCVPAAPRSRVSVTVSWLGSTRLTYPVRSSTSRTLPPSWTTRSRRPALSSR